MIPVLQIHKLSYCLGDRVLFRVENLTINKGDIIHLKGQSGVGKSLFGLSLIGFFSSQSDIEFNFDISSLKVNDWIHLRKNHVGYIFQQPRAYFNPNLTCGRQLKELVSDKLNPNEANELILKFWQRMQLGDEDSIDIKYPHEYSIGQLQRIYTISALIRNPELIIADEPFAHLDWPTSKIVADCLSDYLEEFNASLLLISHEPPGSLVQCNRIWHLDQGQISEHQKSTNDDMRFNMEARGDAIVDGEQSKIISLDNVGKQYQAKFALKRTPADAWALNHISLQIIRGQRLGIMGASGSGKTTLALILCGLLKPSQGQIQGATPSTYSFKTLYRRPPSKIQIVFQDPFSSFNPSRAVGTQIINKRNADLVYDLVSKFGLPGHVLERNSMALSGGELQRLALIRALAVIPAPELLILDESLSALDSDSQNRILDVLSQEFPDLATLYISHRFERLKRLCDQIYFLHKGEFIYNLSPDNSNFDDAPEIVRQLAGQV